LIWKKKTLSTGDTDTTNSKNEKNNSKKRKKNNPLDQPTKTASHIKQNSQLKKLPS